MKKPVFILARKELAMLFNAPATYIVMVTFLLVTGWFFATPLFARNLSLLDDFVGPMPLLLTFVIPALTMRSFSEEFRAGTIEYLATLPIRDIDIVLGKYLGVLIFFLALLGFMLIYPILLFAVGYPDVGQTIGAFIAVFGMASFFAAIGLWASSMSRNQVVSFIIGFFGCFIFFLMGRFADFMPGFLAPFIRALSVEAHFEPLSRGVLDTRDLLYWVSGAFFFLTACLASVHARRWR